MITYYLYKLGYYTAQILKQKRTTDTHNPHEWLKHYSEKNPETGTYTVLLHLQKTLGKKNIIYWNRSRSMSSWDKRWELMINWEEGGNRI